MKDFPALLVIALVNGLIHWQVFFVCYGAAGLPQATSNLAAFCVAAAFSFYLNALYIFEPGESWRGYVLLNGVMGALSYGIGSIGDAWNSPGWTTLVSYSLLSLSMGYGFFRFKWLHGHHRT
ncbi:MULTISPECIES: GtrA family protein [unclassified Pseudomonas]|uniref:GtrA family protein n=1 Tax=unclassified Pseudomonas TaxID=196821 RepID=UPI00089C401B|nr:MULTISPECIES: GtrA family protein [unclassified Pseudomonas]SDX51414.1 GtrA-like protein [Pseudomonas sp. NFACC08-1]SFL99437.1 GtrA-like protein [Pseudomonas sp. NFACC46-3]